MDIILKLLSYLKKYWKPALVVGLITGAFLSGRYLTPEKVKTVTQTVTVRDTDTTNMAIKQQSDVKIQYVDRPVDHIVTRTIIKEPSGKVTDTTIDSVHQGNKTVTKTEEKQKDTQVQIKKEIEYKEKIVEKIVDNGKKDKFAAGLTLGYGLSDKNINYIPSMPTRSVIGAYGTYRVFEFAKTGLFFNSRGDAGVMLEFNW